MTHPHPDLAEVLRHEAGDKRIDILRRIGAVGSISEAARGAGVSYKAAWQALETMNNLAGTPLVEKVVGGSGGGGARLTPEGERVLAAEALLSRSRAEVLAALAPGRAGASASNAPNLAAMGLRTSMRNQFPCTVKALRPHEGLLRVALSLPGDGLLFSRITRDSAQLLGLAPGLPVLALCKATAVLIAAQLDPAAARNVLTGTVGRLSRSSKGGEVVLQLAGGISLVGFASAGHGLKTGDAAMAGVDEAGVVIAMAG
jgi:molybdate transport system regulatory protein